MAVLFLAQSVGRGGANRASDVIAVHKHLMDIGKIACFPCNGGMDAKIQDGIDAVQRHFMLRPDGLISVGGKTHTFLANWEEKPISPGVQLPGRLREAWDWVNPLLPKGSYCSSGFRSADDQRRILHKFYTNNCRSDIIAKYGQAAYDAAAQNLLLNEDEVLKMVRGVGQAIAKPGQSMHQKGKAVDIGGPSDKQQVQVVELVARAHPEVFSHRKPLRERNGCVHFEIV
jgi:hypothetical protein